MDAKLQDQARGRWRSLIASLTTIPAKSLDRKQHPCPICGGTNRFRFDDKNGEGTWFCNSCGAGDGYGLLQKVNGWDFRRVCSEVGAICGDIKADRVRERDRGKEHKDIKALWNSGRRIEHGDVVDRYLQSRGIKLDAFPNALKVVDRLRYFGEEGADPYYACMLAAVMNPEGSGVNVHRTFLALDGSGKAPVQDCRKPMPGLLPDGCAVRLGDIGEDGALGVAEGVETALAASVLYGIPVWACLNEGGLQKFVPPADVLTLYIFGDHDTSFVGQAAAFALAKKAKVRLKMPAVHVLLPPRPGDDWNDVLRAEKEARNVAA